jgi:hypothetical protein
VNHNSQRINDDRPLTEQEQALVRWLLEHGEEHATAFVPQLSDARVVARCTCGCASVDFAIAGQRAPTNGGMDVLSDYGWRDAGGHFFGAFVFARGGFLAGLDLWSIDGQATATRLPEPSELTPIEKPETPMRCSEPGGDVSTASFSFRAPGH